MSLKICEKRKSILKADGHCLVLGRPGSGKTTLALLKAMQRINAGLTPGQSVLFLSFSRAAVARITEAAEKELHLSAERQAFLSVQTFHSFFWQLLLAHGYLVGKTRKLSILLPHDEAALRDGIDRNDPRWPEWEAKRQALFEDEGRVCFDLFAPLAANLLSGAQRIRLRTALRHPLILVDEAQDTNNEQWECVRLLCAHAQVICLADPDQMIYHHIPGVSPARMQAIRDVLQPLEVDLEAENNRSPGTEIAVFARDVLDGKVRGAAYAGVSQLKFRSEAAERDKAIRTSVAAVARRIKKDTGDGPKSVAVLASYTSGVADISAALQIDPPIFHQVLFDEAFTLLASRAAAFLLEPKAPADALSNAATLLELVAAAFRTTGNKTGRDQAAKCIVYAQKCRLGHAPKTKIAAAAASLIAASGSQVWTGRVRDDWRKVKATLSAGGEPSFDKLARSLEYLMTFRRGQRLGEALDELWLNQGNYAGARAALDSALAQDQLLSAAEPVRGVHVMNMHKCKGKQFDGVVLYRQQHHSPFVWRDEPAPHPNSRGLLHMAITRARCHVLVLDEAYSKCPIVGPHRLANVFG